MLSFALYLALAQRAIWGQDAYYLVTFLAQGIDHPVHVLYLRLVGLAVPPLEALGLSLFEAMRACSALGAAIAVWLFWHAARRLLPGRHDPALVAGLCAAFPGVVFFATVVEIHTVFLAFAALSAVAFARCVRAPSALAGLLMGATTALATLVHASGHLLLGLWGLGLLTQALRREQTWASTVLAGGAAALAHAGLTLVGSSWLQPAGLNAPLEGQVKFLESWLRDDMTLAHLPHTLLREWLLPFLPASGLAWLALRRPQGRAPTAALGVALVAYLVAACIILQDTTEQGAYLLPLALPTSLLVVFALPRWMSTLVVGVTLALAVATVQLQDDASIDDSFGRGVAELSEQRSAFVLCRAQAETNSVIRTAARVPCVAVTQLLLHASAVGLDYDQLCAYFDPWVTHHSHGRDVYLSRGAYDLMAEGLGGEMFARFAREYLEGHYQLDPVHYGGFEAFRLTPR